MDGYGISEFWIGNSWVINTKKDDQSKTRSVCGLAPTGQRCARCIALARCWLPHLILLGGTEAVPRHWERPLHPLVSPALRTRTPRAPPHCQGLSFSVGREVPRPRPDTHLLGRPALALAVPRLSSVCSREARVQGAPPDGMWGAAMA